MADRTLNLILSLQDKASKEMSSAFKNAESASKTATKAIAAGMAVAAVAVAGVVKKTMEAGDRIDKMSQKVGLSREAFQQWDFIMSQTGGSVESLQIGMKTLTTQMSNAMDETRKGETAFDKLGIAIDSSMPREEVFNKTIRALQGIENETEKAAIAQELFGRSALELAPLLNGTEAELDELIATFDRLGIAMGDDQVDAAVRVTDAFDQIKRSFSAVFFSMASDLMPAVEMFADWVLNKGIPAIRKFIDIVGSIIHWLMEHKAVLVILAGAIVGIMIPAFVAWATTILTVTLPAIGAMVVALAPFLIGGAIVGGIIAGIWWIVSNWDMLFEKGKEIWTKIVIFLGDVIDGAYARIKQAGEALQGAFKAMSEAIGGFFTSMWEGIKSGVVSGINWVIDKLNVFVRAYNSIIGAVNSVPGVNIPSMPEIPKLADGGIVTKPTLALVGEAGPEAVIPLSKMQGASGGMTVNVTVNGDVSGRDLVDKVQQSIMNSMRSNQLLPL
jgi:hypothetical protein